MDVFIIIILVLFIHQWCCPRQAAELPTSMKPGFGWQISERLSSARRVQNYGRFLKPHKTSSANTILCVADVFNPRRNGTLLSQIISSYFILSSPPVTTLKRIFKEHYTTGRLNSYCSSSIKKRKDKEKEKKMETLRYLSMSIKRWRITIWHLS